MTAGRKVALAVLVTVGLGWLALLASGVWAYRTFGTVSVSVLDENSDVSLHVPGAVIYWALAAVEANHAFVHTGRPSVRLDDREEEIIRIVLEELSAAQDGVFVEVDADRGEHVRIRKHNGDLEIEADDHGASVRVVVPGALAKRMLRFAGHTATFDI
jgi:hypothetical protein